MSGPLPRAIVLDASDGGLVVARSLRRRDVPVTVLAQPHYAWTTRARGVDGRVLGKLDEPGPWLAVLDELAAAGDGVLLPISDRACEFLVRERHRIPANLRSFEGPDSAHLKLMDKASLYTLAAEAGLRVPRSTHVSHRSELDEVAARTPFPCLVKPVLSHRFRGIMGDRRVRVVGDAAELDAEAGPALDAGLELLVSEHVPGPETNLEGAVTVRREDGSFALAYTRCKLRQHPPYFGAGSVLASIDSPEVLAYARRLLDRVGFVGLSSLEAKRHAVTGELVLMEINVRVPQNFGLSEACGVDGPWRLYATLADLPLPPQPAPRPGRKTIVVTLELHAVPAYVGAGDLSIPGLLASYRGVRNASGLSLRDPAPVAAFAYPILARWLRRVASRVASWRHRPAEAPPEGSGEPHSTTPTRVGSSGP
jgi:predicted ATP-grasp superfamily ATP-dependent carboligase